jgi:hypothetical protein
MGRIFFRRYDSSGKFPDGRIKLDVFFEDSEGNKYIWTPDWERGTRHFFLEAYRIERLNKPQSPERERFKQVAEKVLYEEEREKPEINFKLIAIKLGEGLKQTTSIGEINRIASAVFDFDVSPHPHTSITSGRSQTIYDWVMTLSELPMGEKRKSQLLQKFIDNLTPENSPLRKLVEENRERF